MKPTIEGCRQFFKFYIIGASVGWCVVRGVGADFDRDVCDGVDSDVESDDGGKFEL